MASDLAFHFAAAGHDVEAIASRMRYDDPRAGLEARSIENGVRITRVWSTRFGRGSLPGRAIDYATFYLAAFFAIRSSRDAVVIAMTDPPLLSVVAAAALARRAVLVNWLQDLFPEVSAALGFRATRVLRGIRDWSLRRAKINVVIGDSMADRVPSSAVRHNWADADVRPTPRDPNAPFTVAYSGNLGRAHDVATIAGAIRALPDVRFLLTGGGARFDEIPRSANVTTRSYVPREQLSESLGDADVHLVSLQPALEGLIVPSKFYGVLAAGRPVIFIGAKDGELARLIDEHRCGLVVEQGDVEGLVRAIRAIEPSMGERGRALYDARFAPRHAFAAWERILAEAEQ